jgi:hypothetical protein
MADPENNPDVIARADAIVEKIKPLLRGQGSQVQGCVLVELVALWASSHQELDVRRQRVALHYAAVLTILEAIEAEQQKLIH